MINLCDTLLVRMCSSYQKWAPPKFTVDIQFLKRIFEEAAPTTTATATTSYDIVNEHVTFHARLIIYSSHTHTQKHS
jgi:hypothetical protein